MNDIVFVGFLNLPGICLAYVGPGTGITMFWALMAVLGGILFIIFGLLFWPLRVLLRAIRKKKSKNENTPNLNTENSDKTINDIQTLSSPEHS